MVYLTPDEMHVLYVITVLRGLWLNGIELILMVSTSLLMKQWPTIMKCLLCWCLHRAIMGRMNDDVDRVTSVDEGYHD